MASEQEIMLAEMKAMRKALEGVGSKPARGAMEQRSIVSGWDSSQSGRNGGGWHNGWPVEQLKAIGDAYGGHVANDMFLRKASNGRPRVSGIGPALVKLAAMSGNVEAKAAARSQGMGEDYNDENFEKEFGFTTVVKAQNVGLSGPKWGLGPGQIRKAALAEGSGQTGGYVIPPQFMNELLTIAAEDGFIEQRAKVIPMNTRTAQWPMLDITTAQSGGTSPYFGGILAQWQPEAATINETEPAFKQSEWVAWDLVLYTVSSNQLLADQLVP